MVLQATCSGIQESAVGVVVRPYLFPFPLLRSLVGKTGVPVNVPLARVSSFVSLFFLLHLFVFSSTLRCLFLPASAGCGDGDTKIFGHCGATCIRPLLSFAVMIKAKLWLSPNIKRILLPLNNELFVYFFGDVGFLSYDPRTKATEVGGLFQKLGSRVSIFFLHFSWGIGIFAQEYST